MAPGHISCAYHTSAAGVRACFERRKAATGRASGTPRPASWKAKEADDMRANPTPSEELLTAAVYIPAARLVVEIDGRSHFGREAEDGRRDEQMRAERYTVVRVLSSDVERDVDRAAVTRSRADATWRPQARGTVRAMAYPYVCTSCSNFFRTSERPMPDCRRCGSSRHVKVACRCGAVALKGQYRCADCQVVQDAAGPQARAYTGQPPRHAKRGRKI